MAHHDGRVGSMKVVEGWRAVMWGIKVGEVKRMIVINYQNRYYQSFHCINMDS